MRAALALTPFLTLAILLIVFPVWQVRFGTVGAALLTVLSVLGMVLYFLRGIFVARLSRRK